MSTPVLAGPWVPNGMQVLDGATLVGVVVDDGYVFTDTVDQVSDIAGNEVAGASYTRLSATGSVQLLGGAWVLFLTDIDPVDLSDSADRGGIWWATTGATDDDRLLVAFDPDAGPPEPDYLPDYTDGLVDLPVESIDDVLAGLRADVDAALAGTGGASTLAELTDVDLDDPQPGEMLWFHDDLWKNGAPRIVSPNGTFYVLLVADDGTLSTEEA